MAKDYKHRIRGKNTLLRQDFDPVKSLSVWKWMLITAVAISVVVLIVYASTVGLKNISFEQDEPTLPDAQLIESKKTTNPETVTKPVEHEAKPPQFDFYTILSGKEVVVPEYELKTRTREDRIGQAKSTQYVMQAGSYNTRKDAEQMHAKLAAMGIESKIEKAKIGSTFWYRIKMGPFTQVDSVNNVNARLKQNGIDTIVTETGK